MSSDPFDERCPRCSRPLLLEEGPDGMVSEPCPTCPMQPRKPRYRPPLLTRLRRFVGNLAGVVALLRFMGGR